MMRDGVFTEVLIKIEVQWGMLQRTMLQRTVFINKIRMLQRTIFYVFIMESSVIVFPRERLFMLFMCARLFMLFIGERMFIVFNNERLFMLLKFTRGVYKS
jgi:hypothetical protein